MQEDGRDAFRRQSYLIRDDQGDIHRVLDEWMSVPTLLAFQGSTGNIVGFLYEGDTGLIVLGESLPNDITHKSVVRPSRERPPD